MITRSCFLVPLVLATSLLAAPPQAADSPVKLASLTAEHERNPIGIGIALPRLSWKLDSARAGEKQTAYELRAATSLRLLTTAPDLFDTNKVDSDQSILVPWPGKPLASRAQAFWQVRVWDKDGKPSAWSEPAVVEMGVLTPQTDWQGQWITIDLPRYDLEQEPLAKANWIGAGALSTQPVAAKLNINLPADAKVYSASIDANADGLLALYVNGLATKQGPSSHTAPFHADFPHQLKAGANSIGLFSLAVRNSRGGGRNAIAAHGVIEIEGGQRIEFNSDDQWKASVVTGTTPNTWTYNDATWPAAAVIGPYNASKPVASADSTVGPGRYLRKTFNVSKLITKARLYSTALGTYEASINGKPINDHQLDPGWTDYTKRVMVQTTDVTALISQGNNVVGALLSDGWFTGRLGWQGLGSYARVSQRPLFNAQLVIDFADGTSQNIATDNSWKGGGGMMAGSDQQLGEVLDNRAALPWNLATFDDAAWKPASVQAGIAASLDPQVGPPVRGLMQLSPQKITKINGIYVVDLGQNIVGHVRLTAKGPAGTNISLLHGEMLNADGTVYNENLRQAISLDRFILKGDEGGTAPETFEPRFTFHGFRYIQIAGYPGDLTKDAVSGIVVGSDTPDTGTFESSSPDVNRLFQNVRWGQRGNYISIPTDCPQRDERMGWMGDAQAFAPTAARNSDVAGFFHKWLIDVVDGQHADGQYNNVNPVAGQTQSYPVWADAGVVIPWEMYRVYGDKEFLARNYVAMTKWLDYGANANPSLLRSGGVGDHLAPSGRGPGGGRGAGRGAPATAPAGAPARGAGQPSASILLPGDDAFTNSLEWLIPVAAPGGAARGGGLGGAARGGGLGGAARGGAGAARGPGGAGGAVSMTSIVDTAYFARSAWVVSQSAKLLGKPDDAVKYDKLFHDICDAFNQAYVNPTDGTIALASPQTGYILALEFNLVPENLRPMIAKHLADDVAQRQHLTTGFVGVGYINPALSHIGRGDLAYQLLFQDTYPSWLYTVRQGATTMWERWDGYTPETGFQASSMNSFNHYSFGSVGLWFYSGVGGIQLEDPAYKRFSLTPQFSSKLTFAKVTLDTAYGTIASSWRHEGDQLIYDATVPPNTTAELVLPVANAQATGDPAGEAKRTGTTTKWTLPSGTYHFAFSAKELEGKPGYQ